MTEFFNQGWEAFMYNVPFHLNPYSSASGEGYDWEQGWLHAEKHCNLA